MAMFSVHNTGKDDYLKDNKLSLRSKGLLAMMLKIGSWDGTRMELQQFVSESGHIFTNVLKELEEQMYIVTTKTVSETSCAKIIKYTYDVYDTKQISL